MKEIQEILRRVGQLGENEPAVLATVVDVQGSSYRLPGAKMLILGSGETFGTVSGGCLEADVLERAQNVMNSGRAQLFTYDTNSTEDSIFSLNMGCRGVIRILLEPLSGKYFDVLRQNFSERKNFLSVAVIETADEKKFPVGQRSYFDSSAKTLTSGTTSGPISGDATPEQAAIAKTLAKTLEDKCPNSGSVQLEDLGIQMFFECIRPPVNLMIFGAGADAVPLAQIAKSVGWNVSIVDHRPAFATGKRFPVADNIFHARPETLNGNIGVDENTVAVVMSHNYENDKYILSYLLNSPVKYIGALGPKKRTKELLAKLAEDGKNFTDTQLERLFAPVGLDIGATTPEGIALSIVAEIQSFLGGRQGGFLRERNGSIYGHG